MKNVTLRGDSRGRGVQEKGKGVQVYHKVICPLGHFFTSRAGLSPIVLFFWLFLNLPLPQGKGEQSLNLAKTKGGEGLANSVTNFTIGKCWQIGPEKVVRKLLNFTKYQSLHCKTLKYETLSAKSSSLNCYKALNKIKNSPLVQ